jgi:hypothetical protein
MNSTIANTTTTKLTRDNLSNWELELKTVLMLYGEPGHEIASNLLPTIAEKPLEESYESVEE